MLSFSAERKVLLVFGEQEFFLRYSKLNKPSYSKQLHYKYSQFFRGPAVRGRLRRLELMFGQLRVTKVSSLVPGIGTVVSSYTL